jgi:hypothetical protein
MHCVAPHAVAARVHGVVRSRICEAGQEREQSNVHHNVTPNVVEHHPLCVCARATPDVVWPCGCRVHVCFREATFPLLLLLLLQLANCCGGQWRTTIAPSVHHCFMQTTELNKLCRTHSLVFMVAADLNVSSLIELRVLVELLPVAAASLPSRTGTGTCEL